jgi:hypothetical protein
MIFQCDSSVKVVARITCAIRRAGFGMARPVKVRPVTM